MLEILFRGKLRDGHKVGLLKDENGWVYGVPVPIRENTYYHGEIKIIDHINYDELDFYEPSIMGEYVDPDTITQWTGFVDKNGKKIFAGDVVKASWGYIGVVDFNGFIYAGEECTISEDIEVVGNIWDNPELMGRKEKEG